MSALRPLSILLVLAAAAPAQESFRVMSYNIRSAARLGNASVFGIDLPHVPDPLRKGLGGILDVLQDQAVDLVGVQEIQGRNLRSFLTDQAKWLAGNLGFEHAWEEANDALFGAVDRTGIAVLSRWRILEKKVWSLEEGGEGLQPRIAQLTVLEHPDFARPLLFVNTHMNGRGALRGPARMKEMEAIAAEVRGRAGPLILVGDLNVEPDAPQVEFVLGGGLGRPMVDAAAAAPDGSVLTSPAPEPTRRIDFVFVSPEIEVLSCRAVTEAAEASDHLPVVAVLRPRALSLAAVAIEPGAAAVDAPGGSGLLGQ